MNDTTKPDLSRKAVERMANKLEKYAEPLGSIRIEDVLDKAARDAAAMIRALLDAKEAAERRATEDMMRFLEMCATADKLTIQLTEARASVAAAWEAGRDAAIRKAEIHNLGRDKVPAARQIAAMSIINNPDPSATEALRRVKMEVWYEAVAATEQNHGIGAPNPYAAKEAAHG